MTPGAFDADWLALREPVDHRSRSAELAAQLAAWWAGPGRSEVFDLGSGTGSNMRWLAPRLGGRQRWTLIDHDEALLARAVPAHEAPTDRERIEIQADGERIEVRRVVADLTDGVGDHLVGADLVTASALLDLVSDDWLVELTRACARERAGALFALSYDGAIEWGGAPDPDDALVRDAVNAHQRRDKGFGPALGPRAPGRATELFAEVGYRTRTIASPWELGVADGALARTLVEGWARVAAEIRPDVDDRIRAWAERRTDATRTPDVSLSVGHVDILALPARGAER